MADASAPSPRVIQMIDENKEQLRNLFRNYNVLDVQPAISVRLPDDMSALQGPQVTPTPTVPVLPWVLSPTQARPCSPRWRSLSWPFSSSWLPCSSSS